MKHSGLRHRRDASRGIVARRPPRGPVGRRPAYGGTAHNPAYSPLSRNHASNVTGTVAWVLSSARSRRRESNARRRRRHPLRDDSAGPRYVYAVEAPRTGAIRWKYAPEIPPDVQQTTCCGPDKPGRRLRARASSSGPPRAMLCPLDAGTGKELWKAKVP